MPGYTDNTFQYHKVIAGVGFYIGFVENSKNVEYCQPFPLNVLVRGAF